MATDAFIGGVLRTGGKNYPIVDNSSGVVTVQAGGLLAAGSVEVFQDDWEASGDEAPTTRIDTTDAANLYDMLQATTVRANNRYADAYLQPALTTLDQFDQSTVTAKTHFSDSEVLESHFDPFRGSANGEQKIFWCVYVSTGFEGPNSKDNDPGSEDVTRARTSRDVNGDSKVSAIFLEAIRDSVPEETLTDAQLRARIATHEVGHQFNVAAGIESEHRDTPPNIMSSTVGGIADSQFYFHGKDLAFLRERSRSP